MLKPFKIKLLFLAWLFCSIVTAQINSETKRANHWYFGQGAGIDWTTGFPVAVANGQTNSWEGSASISDLNGNLLFYSDGNTIWNKNHVPMQGGNNLLNCNGTGVIQVSQNALIIPHPGNDSLYYLFHIGCLDFTIYTLRYTIVNIKLNGGLGKVVSPLNPLMKTRAQGLSACRHSDGCSIWVVALDTLNFHNFFKMDIGGLNLLPVKQFSGLLGQVPLGYTSNYKFSNDLKMMANVTFTGYQYDSLIIHQFNNTNATLSNQIRIFTGDETVYDVCFSPDNKKLYTSMTSDANGAALVDTLYQYDLNVYNQSAVLSSKTIIYADSMSTGHMLNGPDGKIYMSRVSTTFIFGNADSIAVINNPNAVGVACNFNRNSIYLQGKKSLDGLPNFDQGYFYPALINSCITSLEEITTNSFNIYPNPFTENFRIKNEVGFDFSMTIMDINNNQIYSGFIRAYQYKNISLENFPSGVYILKLNNQTKSINYKLLKN